METRFKIRPKNKKESYLVMCFSLPGKKVRIQVPTLNQLLTKHWGKGEPLKTAPKELRTEITQMQLTTNKYIDEMQTKHKRLPTEIELKAFVAGLNCTSEEKKVIDNQTQLERLVADFLEQKNDVGKSTKDTIEFSLNLLLEFRDDTYKNKLDVDDITPKFDVAFNKWLFEVKGYENETFNTYKKKIRQFFNWCFDNGHLPTSKALLFKLAPSIEKPVIALLPEEIEKLEQTKFKNEGWQQAIDLLLFCSYTSCRFQDTQLDKEAIAKGVTFKDYINNDVLHLLKSKTADSVGIPLMPEAKAILKRYNYVLPVMLNQTVNKYLHKAFESIKLNRMVKIVKQSSLAKSEFTEEFIPLHEAIGMHKGRKTYCTTALDSGMAPHIVKKVGGWKTDRSFAKYISYNPQQIKEEMNKMNRSKKHLKKVA